MAEKKAGTRLVVLAFVVLAAMSVLVRVATFDRFLPVIDQYDESLRFLHAHSIRADAPLGRSWGQIRWEAGFPPFQPWFTGWIQRVVEARMTWPMPSDYIYAMRIVSLVLGVLTTALRRGWTGADGVADGAHLGHQSYHRGDWQLCAAGPTAVPDDCGGDVVRRICHPK